MSLAGSGFNRYFFMIVPVGEHPEWCVLCF